MHFKDIPNYHTFHKIEPVNKGWSSDKKYYITTTCGEHCLLRITDIAEFSKKKEEYDLICIISKLGIPMSQPIDFGICNDGNSVFMLLSWIDGEDAESVLGALSEEEQYALGVKAGRILKRIHTLSAPATQEEWEQRFNRKIDIKIQKYLTCGIKIDGEEKILSYIEENRNLLKNRPQSIHHGDYHVGNMILSKSGKLSIIDFNRFDYGDPWEEFNRIVWCAACSKHFATGRIDGYFDNSVPYLFWQLLALYISSNTLSSIYWAILFGNREITTMLNQARDVLHWYDNMENPIPCWYIQKIF